jgi:mutator family transposase
LIDGGGAVALLSVFSTRRDAAFARRVAGDMGPRRVKIRDEGLVKNKAVYVALALNPDGEKSVLGLWIEQAEGAKFWLNVVNELKARGVNDNLIAVVGRPQGLSRVHHLSVPANAISYWPGLAEGLGACRAILCLCELNAPAGSHCPVRPQTPGRTHRQNRDRRPPVAMSSLLKVSVIERP